MRSPAPYLRRSLIFVHRWLGVVLCVLFLLWFPSGIVMMYRTYPEVRPEDRIAHAPAIDRRAIRLTPADAYTALNAPEPPRDVRLGTFDGRPAYRFGGGRGERIVYADTGQVQETVDAAMMLRAAARWTGQPARDARVESLDAPDQWTLQIFRRAPLKKFTFANGDQVYVSATTGEVVQATTQSDRFWAYLGAIPHWLYFTPLRSNGLEWTRVVVWTSGIGTIAAILGLAVGVWMYSPSKRYRIAGTATSIPYTGQKRWHTIFGLVFGVVAATWAFSGLLSMDPFPSLTSGEPPEGPSPPNVSELLRGAASPLSAFDDRDVRTALAAIPAAVKEVEFTSCAGEPVYLATLGTGGTYVIPVHGAPRSGFDAARIMALRRDAPRDVPIAELRVIDRYDRYYLDRHNERPLPAILARFDDPQHTRYYIDPKTARVVGGYQDGEWIERWLYHSLHSLDFPWLYNYRPLWDIVVLTLLIGGTALCVTSLVLAWRVIGRKLRRATWTSAVPAES
jgi:hypothetical protein